MVNEPSLFEPLRLYCILLQGFPVILKNPIAQYSN